MPTATFIIFRDDVPESLSRSGIVEEQQSSPFRVVVHHPGPQLVFNAEKENINPVTGMKSSIDHTKKKRKTDVLATKLQVAPPLKKKKELKEKEKEGKESKAPKKRAATALATTTPKPTSSPEKKKGKRVLGARRNGAGTGPSRLLRSPSLPQVVEEPAVPQIPLSQAQVDARCYELTVLPLADVSQAYDESPRRDEHLVDEKEAPATEALAVALTPKSLETPRIVRENTPGFEDEVERAAAPALSTKEVAAVVPFVPEDALDLFSTPNRKRIYHSFTFTSPSPAGKRYAAVRESVNDRFSDICDFEF